jgi:hypothetical protein
MWLMRGPVGGIKILTCGFLLRSGGIGMSRARQYSLSLLSLGSTRGVGRSRVIAGFSIIGNGVVGGSLYSVGLVRLKSGFSKPVSQKLVVQQKVWSLSEQKTRWYRAWTIGGNVLNWI